jgi:hypothetical protein
MRSPFVADRLVLVMPFTLSLLACTKTTPDPSSVGAAPSSVGAAPSTAGAAPTASQEAAATVPGADVQGGTVVPIRILGIKGRLPAGTPQPEVGGDTQMVLVDAGKFAVRLWATRARDPQTLADAEAMVKTLKATKSKSEMFAGGWSVAYESFGWRYDVIASRDVAGKAYHCEASAESADDQAAAVAFCESLAK